LHGTIVGPTGRSDQGYTSDCLSDQSDRPIGQTVAEPPTSVNQINVACYRVRCSVIGRPTGQSVRPVGRSVHTLRQSDRQFGRNQTCLILPTVCPTGRTKRLHDTIVWPTGRTDQSDRPVGPTIGTC